MKINRDKYIADIKSLQEQLRAQKTLLRAPGSELVYSNHARLHELKAQVTRLYALRAEYRGRIHPVDGGFRIYFDEFHKKTRVESMDGVFGARFKIDHLGRKAMGSMLEQLTPAAAEQGIRTNGCRAWQQVLIDGEPGWKDQYLIQEPLPAAT